MVELIMQIDERIYRELELRAQRRQRSVSEEAAELLRLALYQSPIQSLLIARQAL
jgi:plasmid stability protein